MIERLVVLGASGDLTARYLVPALARLHDAGRLPAGSEIVGVAREEWNDDDLRAHARRHLSGSHPVVDLMTYVRADVTDAGRLASAFDERPAVAYLALPPEVFAPAIAALDEIGLPEGSHVVVEKPFGEDLGSAIHLNELLARSFDERSIFRIDHFLHLRTVQNVLALRFANRLFDAIWNRDHIERVEVVWDETLALEGRAGYYDRAGALKDMIQNHLLQVMCLVAMEAPPAIDETYLRDAKVDVLRRVRRLSPDEVERHCVRARYTAGAVEGRAVRAYADEAGVDPDRDTETFAEVTLFLDEARWQGVPFTLRSGKALRRDRHEIAVFMRPFAAAFCRDARPNVLRMHIEPDAVDLEINVNGPGDPFSLERTALTTALESEEPAAYGRLLLDVLEGDPTLSIRGDEAEEAWRIMEPILDAWAKGVPPLHEYEAGSDGPKARTCR